MRAIQALAVISWRVCEAVTIVSMIEVTRLDGDDDHDDDDDVNDEAEDDRASVSDCFKDLPIVNSANALKASFLRVNSER